MLFGIDFLRYPVPGGDRQTPPISILEESVDLAVRSGMGFIEEARNRAKRRNSAWNLLLIPAVLFPLAVTWGLLVFGFESVHSAYYPGQSLKNGSGVAVVLTTVCPLFTAIPVGMLVGNWLVWLLPAARRKIEVEAINSRAADFVSSQKLLFRASAVVLPVSLGLSFIGALLPWL